MSEGGGGTNEEAAHERSKHGLTLGCEAQDIASRNQLVESNVRYNSIVTCAEASCRDSVIENQESSISWIVSTASAMLKETSTKWVKDIVIKNLGLSSGVVVSERIQRCVKRRMTILSHDVRRWLTNWMKWSKRSRQSNTWLQRRWRRWRISTIRTKVVYIHDFSGKTLSNDTVIEAQRTEFNTLQDKNVYKYVRRTEAQSRDKIIDVRWIDSFK